MKAHSSARGAPVCSDSGSGSDEDHQSRIRSLEHQIAELRVENAQLREAAKGFGELAERLNEMLRKMTQRRT
jgi:hypothetical protein